jgi:hypothetical protein
MSFINCYKTFSYDEKGNIGLKCGSEKEEPNNVLGCVWGMIS